MKCSPATMLTVFHRFSWSNMAALDPVRDCVLYPYVCEKAWGRYHVIFFNPSCPTQPIIGRHTKNLDQYKAANMHKWSVLFSLHGKKNCKNGKKIKQQRLNFVNRRKKNLFQLLSMRQMYCYIYIIYKYIYTCPFWVSLLSPVALSNIKHVQ